MVTPRDGWRHFKKLNDVGQYYTHFTNPSTGASWPVPPVNRTTPAANPPPLPPAPIPLPPDHLAFTVEPSDTAAGATITPAVRVSIEDVLNHVVTSDTSTVTIDIDTNPSGGTLSGTLSVAAVAGVAIFNDLSIDLAGDGYILHASNGAVTDALSTPFDMTLSSVGRFAAFATYVYQDPGFNIPSTQLPTGNVGLSFTDGIDCGGDNFGLGYEGGNPSSGTLPYGCNGSPDADEAGGSDPLFGSSAGANSIGPLSISWGPLPAHFAVAVLVSPSGATIPDGWTVADSQTLTDPFTSDTAIAQLVSGTIPDSATEMNFGADTMVSLVDFGNVVHGAIVGTTLNSGEAQDYCDGHFAGLGSTAPTVTGFGLTAKASGGFTLDCPSDPVHSCWANYAWVGWMASLTGTS